jgi:hypothetical protein
MSETTLKKPLDVFVVTGKRKPVATGKQVEGDTSKRLPETFTHQGTEFHLAYVDLVAKTITYVNVPLNWH